MYMVDLEEVSILRNSMSMSNSELISAKKHDDLEDSNHRPHPTLLEFQDHKQEEEEEAIANEVFLLKKPFLGEIKVKENDEDEGADDDGIRTPTSLDHKIPVMRQCPPAPRKAACKPLGTSQSISSSSRTTTTTKRKLPPRRNLQLIDVSKEVESMFPPLVFANIGKKIKKARLDRDSEVTN